MSNNIAAFTEACIDQNTIEELYFVYGVNGPDEMDMMTWGLSEEEWGEAICRAIAALEDTSA